MKIIVLNGVIGEKIIKDVKAIPRIGEKIDLFYTPLPVVIDVIWYPTKETLSKIDVKNIDIDALIFTD